MDLRRGAYVMVITAAANGIPPCQPQGPVHRLLALPDAIAAASPARREELCRLVVERVVVDDRRIDEIV
jgi:hypothetical protein